MGELFANTHRLLSRFEKGFEGDFRFNVAVTRAVFIGPRRNEWPVEFHPIMVLAEPQTARGPVRLGR